jgi:RimJ/RimL family protein N-acetyltransferase
VKLRLPLEIEGFELREFHVRDIPRLCALANDYEIWRRVTDLFPRPYDERAGLRWVMQQAELDPPCNLAISGPDGIVGGVGVMLSTVPNFAHDGEVGYWLGAPYWGRGLTTAALRAFCAWAAAAHGLGRFTAKVYAGKTTSVRVLEKCGFVREGSMRRAVRKEGETLDLLVYGLVVDGSESEGGAP